MLSLRRFPALLAVTSASLLFAACGGKVIEGSPIEEIVVAPAASAEVSLIELSAVADETRISLSWTRKAAIPEVVKWVVYGEGPEGDYASQLEVPGGGTASSAMLTDVESGKTYKLFVAGLTESGKTAPEVEEGGPIAASTVVTVTPGVPLRGEPRDALIGHYDSPNIVALGQQSLVMVFRQDGNLYSAISGDRGGKFVTGRAIAQGVDAGAHAVADPARGIIVACFKKQDGVHVATSVDGGATYTTQLLGAGEGPSCGVALGPTGTFLVTSAVLIPGEGETGAPRFEIRVRRSSDGLVFEEPVLAATPNAAGAVVIVADPKQRGLSGALVELVYIGFEQTGASGSADKDVFLAVSEDGGRTFRSDGAGLASTRVHEVSGAAQRNPSLAVDPESGELWIAFEDLKVSTIRLARSNDFGKTAGAPVNWMLDKGLGSTFNPALRAAPGGKIYLAFAAGVDPKVMYPHLTRFDLKLMAGAGGFEAPQPGAATALKLGTDPMAGTNRELSEWSGPAVGSDGIMSDYVVWARRGARLVSGDLQMSMLPQ